MVFNSFEFLLFFPVVTLLYFLFPHKLRWIVLLISSYYFYIAWNYSLLWLILFTTAITYIAALLLQKTDSKKLKKIILIFSLMCCLGVLIFFKYFDFLSVSVTGILNTFNVPVREYTLNLILPVGISFYTFQTLSYVIDVYRGDIDAECHFGYYALYVSYFPQLVAGPIERPDSIIPQLKAYNQFTFKNLSVGIKVMILGFVKKIVVADTIAAHVNSVYNNVEKTTGLSVLIATLLFAVQIYCDFSGYTDIAIGCARIMNIRLMKNFDYPYLAKSVKEFWSRWHISLSSWLKDYIYIPLGGNRCSKSRNLMNISIVFLISGIWHGAAWTFVLWGVLHAIYQIIGAITIDTRNNILAKLGFKQESKIVAFSRMLITFLLVNFAWMLFRANTISDFGNLSRRLFTDWAVNKDYIIGTMDSLGCSGYQLLVCALCIVVMILCDMLYSNETLTGSNARAVDSVPLICKRKVTMILVWIIAIAWLLLLSQNGASSFIYFQF